jgi:enoyl-CoA hydratase
VYDDVDSLVAGARQLASSIARNSPIVVQGTKAVLRYSEEHSLDDGKQFVAVWNAAFLRSDDLTEAMMAFMQKRPPKFRNRL